MFEEHGAKAKLSAQTSALISLVVWQVATTF